MVTNVYAKSNYDRLRIDKALGFVNMLTTTTTRGRRTTFVAIGDPSGSKNWPQLNKELYNYSTSTTTTAATTTASSSSSSNSSSNLINKSVSFGLQYKELFSGGQLSLHTERHKRRIYTRRRNTLRSVNHTCKNA